MYDKFYLKHVQRFFSYLSLFTFMMIILVTANNYLLMFVGWEGYLNSLRWLNLYKSKYFNKNIPCAERSSSWVAAPRNITINNKDCISLIIGSLLGNSYMEKNEKGVRIVFIKCSGNIEYLIQFFNYLSNIGYCKSKKPKLNKVISKNNKVLYYFKTESYYLTQLEWLYKIFYKNNMKTISLSLKEYLTPLSITTWYLDNTNKLYVSENQGFYLNNKDLEYISQIFKDKFNINTTYKLESKGKVAFYIEKETFNHFNDLTKPYISSSLQYKLNNPYNKLVIWNNLNSPLRKNSSSKTLMQNGLPPGKKLYYSC